jgi:hypothetical protein
LRGARFPRSGQRHARSTRPIAGPVSHKAEPEEIFANFCNETAPAFDVTDGTRRQKAAARSDQPKTNSIDNSVKLMKAILTLAIAIASVSMTLAPTSSEAGGRRYYAPSHCAPYYVTTKVLCRHYECRYAKDHCGRSYSYRVAVTTYADVYSNGSQRTYTRVERA